MKHALNDISAEDLKKKMKENPVLKVLDVREELEFHTFNIGGQNVPLNKLPEAIDQLSYNKEEEIIVICQRGLRSETARKILKAAGFTGVKNLYGGLLAYRKTTE